MRVNKKGDEKVYLTLKERVLLKFLLRNGRASNSSIAKRLKISRQSVSRMRRKLEAMGLIKDYYAELDYGLMGVNAFALALFDIEDSHEEEVMSQNMICFYKVITNSATHIALYAFDSLDKLDDYFKNLESKNSKFIKMLELHVFPKKCMLKNSPIDFFQNIIKNFNKDYSYMPNDIPYSVGKKKRKRYRRLSNNEKKVLRFLAIDGKIPCKRISAKIGESKITGNGVNAIKNRLERRKVIRGYSIKLDYKKMGINTFAFILFSRKPKFWNFLDCLRKWAKDSPNIISCFRLNGDHTHVVHCGFKDLNELERYCNTLQEKNKELFKIKNIYIVSPDGIIKESSSDLFLNLLS